MSLVIVKGLPAITWGTGNTLGAPAGAIVESARLTAKNGQPIDIEDNNALSANLVILRDGFSGKVSVMYDANKAWPVEGANVAFSMTINGVNANSYPFGEGNAASVTNSTVTYYCSLISIEPAYQRRKELMIDLGLVYRPNVSP